MIATVLRPLLLAAALAAVPLAPAAAAQADPLDPGWTLQPDQSHIRFQSTKNGTKVEAHGFARFEGRIAADGATEIDVLLDSVDTKIDIRNVRMRFLFFETFNTPIATVQARVDPALLPRLAAERRIVTSLPFTLTWAGVERSLTAEVVATLLSDDRVTIASLTPIPLLIEEFGLMERLAKLEDAAGGVSIIPVVTLSFNLLFDRDTPEGPAPARTPQSDIAATNSVRPIPVAMESAGAMAVDECRTRFLALSESNGIRFEVNSTRISRESAGILTQLADTIERCPGLRIEIGSHTDSGGARTFNQQISEDRAEAVAAYLIAEGIAADRLEPRGFGEDRPAFAETTRENRLRNRRIEFTIIE